MRLLIKEKAYGLCRSCPCQKCEFYDAYSNGLWCEFPFGEIHYFKNRLVRPIKQDEVFKL